MNDHTAASERYEIRIAGHLASRWAATFDGMTLTQDGDGSTVLSGELADQAALHGVLRRLGDLGLPIKSVRTLAAGDRIYRSCSTPPPVTPTQTRSTT